MHFDFLPAPTFPGLTYLAVKPAFIIDPRTGRRLVFPLYYYKDETTGELVTVAEDRYEAYHDMVNASGVLGPETRRS